MTTIRLYHGEYRHSSRESLPATEKYRMQPGELTSSTWVIEWVILSKPETCSQKRFE